MRWSSYGEQGHHYVMLAQPNKGTIDTMRSRLLTIGGVLAILIAGFASGYAAGGQTPKVAPAAPVSDALKLRAERLKVRAANLQIAVLQIEREKASIEAEGRVVGDELRKALGAKPNDDIDLVNYVIVKKQGPVAEPPAH